MFHERSWWIYPKVYNLDLLKCGYKMDDLVAQAHKITLYQQFGTQFLETPSIAGRSGYSFWAA